MWGELHVAQAAGMFLFCPPLLHADILMDRQIKASLSLELHKGFVRLSCATGGGYSWLKAFQIIPSTSL